MSKKIITILVLLISNSSVLAKATESSLTVLPSHPDNWGYQNATVNVNHGPVNFVGKGITIPVSVNKTIDLTVYAMNAKPKLSPSCLNLKIQRDAHYTLLFELKPDWLIHCQFKAE